MNPPPGDYPLPVIDLGLCKYKPAWDRQLEIHDEVLRGISPRGAIILVEHPPVITFGRRPGSADHLLVDAAALDARGIEVVQSDRGGDITFHGPGQLVAYPIIPLQRYHLGLLEYMRLLENAIIAAIEPFGISGCRDICATGVWVQDGPAAPTKQDLNTGSCGVDISALKKICAIGVKLRRWISLHGVALNVTTDLAYFDLINPCGLSRPVTSMQKLLGSACPPMAAVKASVAEQLQKHLDAQRQAEGP